MTTTEPDLAGYTIQREVDGKLLTLYNFDNAKMRTDELVEAAGAFTGSLNRLADLVARAYADRIFISMGYEATNDGYQQYLDDFIGPRLRGVKMLERRPLVQAFTQLGMSTRVQASILGVDHKTVVNDQKSTRDGEDSPSRVPLPSPDGKVYDRNNPKTFTCSECKRKDIPYEKRVEIDGFLYCEHCSETAPRDAEITPEQPKVKRRSKTEIERATALDQLRATLDRIRSAIHQEWSLSDLDILHRTLSSALTQAETVIELTKELS